MSKLIQSDVQHPCRSRMWYCCECKEDFCMGEQPKFCPECGKKVTEVKLRDENWLDETQILEVERVLDKKRILRTDYCLECDNALDQFTVMDDKDHEVIIRRYLGQFGHLIDVGFHPRCYDTYRKRDLVLGIGI